MIRKAALNFGAVVAGIILSLLFLEAALRIYNPIVRTVEAGRVVINPNYDEIRRNIRILGVEKSSIPGVASEVHIHQNSLGFRGPEPPADFADWLTIISVGGSTTRSAAQSDDGTWTALLGGALAGCFNHVWINNAGFDGHSSFAHIDLIRSYIEKLHPKLVVLLIGANELVVNPEVGHRPPGMRGRIHVEMRHFLDAVARRSEVVDLGLTLYRSFHAWQIGFNQGSLAEGQPMPEDGDARLAAATAQQSDYADRLRLIIRLLREARSVPVLMTQPSLGGIGRDPTTGSDLSHLWYGLFFERAFAIYNATMRQVAQSEHVHLIDLEHLMPKDTKYYYDNVHFTDAGAAKVAALVTSGLQPYLVKKFPSFNKGSCQIPEGEAHSELR
jgi:lysophospholipase L1-like esterase